MAGIHRGPVLVLCTGAGVPEPEPEFWPILPEMSRSLFNSGKTYFVLQIPSDIGKKI